MYVMEVANIKKSDDDLKNEVIAELGLVEKVKQFGWKGLSAKETGRIGGIIARRKKLWSSEKGQQA